jgi:hypothetical protein
MGELQNEEVSSDCKLSVEFSTAITKVLLQNIDSQTHLEVSRIKMPKILNTSWYPDKVGGRL